MCYLVEMELFPTELSERVGDEFEELDELVRKQDQLIDHIDTDWLDDWLDGGFQGFIESERDLLEFIPIDSCHTELRDVVERIVEILGDDAC